MNRAYSLRKKRRLPHPPKCVGVLYTVRPGDTLFGIAQQFQVTVNQILAANPQIKDPNIIFAGQVICIPTQRVPRPKPDDRPPLG